MITHQHCLARFSEILGVDIVLDEKKQALLSIEGSLFISLRFLNQRWLVYGMVKQLDYFAQQQRSPLEWVKWLTVNPVTQEPIVGSLCYLEETNAVLYVDAPTDPITSGDELYQFVDGFTQRLQEIVAVAA